MARIKLGAMVTAIKGKIGGTVFKGGRYGAVATNKPNGGHTHTNERPLCVLVSNVPHEYHLICYAEWWLFPYYATRSSFMPYIASQWRGLTLDQAASWNSGAATFPQVNSFGDSYIPTGFNLFVKINTNLAVNSLALVLTCPIPPVMLVPPVQGIVITEDGLVNVIMSDPIPAAYILEIWASGTYNANSSRAFNKRSIVGYIKSITGIAASFQLKRRKLWGYIKRNQKINFSYRYIHIGTGIAGPFYNSTVTVQPPSGLALSLTYSIVEVDDVFTATVNWVQAGAIDVLTQLATSIPVCTAITEADVQGLALEGSYEVVIAGGSIAVVSIHNADGMLMQKNLSLYPQVTP